MLRSLQSHAGGSNCRSRSKLYLEGHGDLVSTLIMGIFGGVKGTELCAYGLTSSGAGSFAANK